MTAPGLAYKKFYIITPMSRYNYIVNPDMHSDARNDPTDVYAVYSSDSSASLSIAGYAGTATKSSIGRRGVNVAVVTCTGGGKTQYIFYPKATSGFTLPVVKDSYYNFSVDVRAPEGEKFYLVINMAASPYTYRKQKTFLATGYWERQSLGYKATATENVRVAVVRHSDNTGAAVFKTDGWQFENGANATTFFTGDTAGFGASSIEFQWRDPSDHNKAGIPYQSHSLRSQYTRRGGWPLPLERYCSVVAVTGLGNGEWNQIAPTMTSGGSYYQQTIRKARQFSIVVDFLGDTLGEIENNRAVIMNALQPDFEPAQPVVIRYQGESADGYQATQPIDIVCVPMPGTLTDTPDLPSHQRAVLNFVIPDGLLEGAYEEGIAL